ncbi:MAG: CarD family transcriptional regulator [Clostridia bacterium]|nr:CarD family transcriptional regulator [Clostridia bacterium]
MSLIKYNVGEYVVYSTSGICRITDIKNMTLSPIIGERNYYILEQIGPRASTIYVATDNETLCAKMRYVLGEKEIKDILRRAKDGCMNWIEDRKERFRAFHDILTGSSHEDLILMISCIYLKNKELSENKKKISDSDASILHSAEKIIREEFTFALGISADEIGPFIRRELGLSEITEEI